MKRIRELLAALLSILIGALLAGPAAAAIACGAVGGATENGDGTFTYCVTVTWDFEGYAVPERISLLLDSLDGCEFYDPQNPEQADYLVPLGGTSLAGAGCGDVSGHPAECIDWVGWVAEQSPDCWVETLHLSYANSGTTADCLPLSDDVGLFCFKSYGYPLPAQTYYGAVVIKAGEYCLSCDYTGPLPDCHFWSPVSVMRWGTIKALYR